MPTGKIQVLLVSAKGLHDTDFWTKMDPYVTITCKTHEQKSNVASGQGSSPEWNETFEFSVTGEVPEVVIKIKDSDVGKDDDIVGEAKIPLEPLFLAGSYRVCFPLCLCSLIQSWTIYRKTTLFIGLMNYRIYTRSIPPTPYNVVINDEFCGEIKVGLEFIPDTHEHDHRHHGEERSFGGWKESSY